MVANIAICLIHQANYLLDRQIRRLEQDFLKEGGLRKRMTCARWYLSPESPDLARLNWQRKKDHKWFDLSSGLA